MSGGKYSAIGLWLVAVACLAVIASWSPVPERATDRGIYEDIAAQWTIPGCRELHCFRPLVPWTVGRLPGPAVAKWRMYAVIMNAMAGAGVAALCLQWGLSRRVALLAAVASVFGFGSLYTLHDSFTSDPLMFAIGPWAVWLLERQQLGWAALVAMVGVTAKEFAVAPVYVFAGASWLRGHSAVAIRVFAVGTLAVVVWLALQLFLMSRFDYSYGNSASANVLGGGYLAAWLNGMSGRAAVAAMAAEFGALWLLAPAGFAMAPRNLQLLVLAALPVAALFAYVQQPDRALWNFHFLATPLAALVLAGASAPLAWATLSAFVFANLRLGAQIAEVPAARFALLLSMGLAVGCIATAWRQRTPVTA
jgi:hypothetical protein